MKVEIRIGDISSGERIKYSFSKFDDINREKHFMYTFLANCENCIIEEVDVFLLYALNNGIMAFNIKDNIELQKEDYKNEICNLMPKFNPKVYRAYEIKENGSEILLQNKDGYMGNNYFDFLMGEIKDDYYSCLNFYEPTNENKNSIK